MKLRNSTHPRKLEAKILDKLCVCRTRADTTPNLIASRSTVASTLPPQTGVQAKSNRGCVQTGVNTGERWTAFINCAPTTSPAHLDFTPSLFPRLAWINVSLAVKTCPRDAHPRSRFFDMPAHHTLIETYGQRSERPGLTPLATYLLQLMHFKRTNLCLSADVSTTGELLQLAEEVGDQICILKTHADIIKDFTDRTASRLAEIARRRQFVIFEDRKLGDIGSMLRL